MASYRSDRLDHLGIVAGICDELGLVEEIDGLIPCNREISAGTSVLAMVLNCLGYSQQRLYLTPQYFKDKPIELLLGKGVTAEKLNDDTLGRTLDDIYKYGEGKLLYHIASKAIQILGQEEEWLHLDSTSFSLEGEYNFEEGEPNALKIVHGYSKDKRPDLKQIMTNIICVGKNALPVWMESLSGNTSDRNSFEETISAFIAQLNDNKSTIKIVADSAWYKKEMLQSAQYQWISRVPNTLTCSKEILTNTIPMTKLDDNYSFAEIGNFYAGVKQTWVILHSKYLEKMHNETLLKRLDSDFANLLIAIKGLEKQEFKCKDDAILFMNKEFPQNLFGKYFGINFEIEEQRKFINKGRPKPDSPQKTFYCIKIFPYSIIPSIYNKKVKHGKFIIATNEIDRQKLSISEIFQNYKDQNTSSEMGMRFLKDPMFFAEGFFLKNPKRIASMIHVMVLSLLIYTFAELKLRKNLSKENLTVPNQVGKLTSTPTLRYIFEVFTGLSIITITNEESTQIIPPEISQIQKTVLCLLGSYITKYYQNST